jgi:hypothetical protein
MNSTSMVALAWFTVASPALAVLFFLYAGRSVLRRKGLFLFAGIVLAYASFSLVNWAIQSSVARLWTTYGPAGESFAIGVTVVLSLAVPAAVVFALFKHFTSGGPGMQRWETVLKGGPVAGRFWWGVALPTLGLALFIVLIVATGRGKEWAPMVAFFASFVAVPATMLINCWVLFVNWKNRGSFYLGASAIPAVVGIGMSLSVHGTGASQTFGAAVLAPILVVFGAAARFPRSAFALWIVAMIALYLGARALESRGREP